MSSFALESKTNFVYCKESQLILLTRENNNFSALKQTTNFKLRPRLLNRQLCALQACHQAIKLGLFDIFVNDVGFFQCENHAISDHV